MSLKEGQHPKIFINSLLILLAVGIILSRNIKPSMTALLVGGGILLLMLLCAGVLIHFRSRYVALCLMGSMLLLGVLRGSTELFIWDDDIEKLIGKEITVTGELVEEPLVRQDSSGELHVKYVIGDITVREGEQEYTCRNNLIVYAGKQSYDVKNTPMKGSDFEFEKYGQVGDRLQTTGKVMKIHDYQNPGRMDVVMANYAKGIHGQLRAGKYSTYLYSQDKNILARTAGYIRHLYKQAMDKVMPGTDSAAIFAMLFGGYGGIKEELLEAFTVTGLIHILSVSGSHITLMAGVANAMGRTFGLPNGAVAGLATVIIVVYSLLAGLVLPVIRSAAMGILTVIALAMGRERDAQHILSLTALGILLLWPLALFDISFQLSFGATAGLLYISPRLRQSLYRPFPKFIADNMSVTIGAQLGALPFIAWYFNVVSISSLLANLLVAPIIELIIVISLFSGIIVGLVPLLGKVIFISSSMLLGLAYELSRFIAKLPGGQLYIPAMSWQFWCVYYFLVLLCAAPDKVRVQAIDRAKFLFMTCRKAGKYVLVCGLLLAATGAVVYVMSPREMSVHFIDVGQGDGALVITPHGRAFMIDVGGNRKGSYNIGARVDVPYLLHYGVRKLDFIMLTHAHEDHAQGVGGILGRLPVGTVMIGHEGLEEYLKSFGVKNPAVRKAKYVMLQEGTKIDIDGVTVQVLFAPEKNQLAGNATGNEFSNLIRVSYGKHSFLFTGDLTAEYEKTLIKQGKILNSTVLKVAHHGSSTSSTEEFLRVVSPEWSVISVGYGNSFGHPDSRVLNRIKACTDSEILRTDKNGAVVFFTDGENLRVDTQIMYDDNR